MLRNTLLLVLVLAAAPALAQSRSGRSDFYFSPTFVNGQSQVFEGGSSVQTDTGYGFALAWDHNIDAHWAAGLEFAWGQMDYRATLKPADTTQPDRRISGTILTSSLRFNGTYNLAAGPLTPFLNFNGGWTYVDTGIPNGPPQNFCYYYPWYGCTTYVPTKSSTKFAYGAGLGVRADIGRTFTVRGWVSQQWIEIGSVGFTPWTQWRIDIGSRF
jgi:opacity protein-like surface antigen